MQVLEGLQPLESLTLSLLVSLVPVVVVTVVDGLVGGLLLHLQLAEMGYIDLI